MAAPVTEEQFTALQLLLKAPSKEAVKQLCQDGFSWRGTGSVESTASSLSITAKEAQQLLGALHSLSHHVLFHGLSSPEQLLAVFPDTFHPSLKNLLTKILLEHRCTVSPSVQNTFLLTTILLEHSPTWRNEALSNQISLPQLVDMDWRVDIKTASDSVARMAVPTCLVQMKVQDDPCLCGPRPGVSTVTVELSKETLETMLDGLGRIRDQLSAVASK